MKTIDEQISELLKQATEGRQPFFYIGLTDKAKCRTMLGGTGNSVTQLLVTALTYHDELLTNILENALLEHKRIKYISSRSKIIN
ncbi:MAG: hypothetical protein ACUZ8H_16380 [Candidatus Anammoxibacter sp.]